MTDGRTGAATKKLLISFNRTRASCRWSMAA